MPVIDLADDAPSLIKLIKLQIIGEQLLIFLIELNLGHGRVACNINGFVLTGDLLFLGPTLGMLLFPDCPGSIHNQCSFCLWA